MQHPIAGVTSRTTFRKAACCVERAYVPGIQSFPVRARACFEGPFGEVIRATGPMAKANPLRFSTKYQDDETDLLYYGYRYYSASTGRWLSRDPIGETAARNLYAFVNNAPPRSFDINGLWGADVHYDYTRQWAQFACDYPNLAAVAVAAADEAVDGPQPGGIGYFPWGDQSYHFNRSTGGEDSRLKHTSEHFRTAEDNCTWSKRNDNPEEAAKQLGTALHPLQDWVAHGDYFIHYQGAIMEVHNVTSPQELPSGWPDKTSLPDTTWLDAVGSPDGRAAGAAMHLVTSDITGAQRSEYAIYTYGTRRLNLTGQLTREKLDSFRSYVKEHGGCKCKKFFGVQ